MDPCWWFAASEVAVDDFWEWFQHEGYVFKKMAPESGDCAGADSGSRNRRLRSPRPPEPGAEEPGDGAASSAGTGKVHLVDIWNIIEALRENSLNNLDPNVELNVARLEAVLSTIFYQLNKRMPTTHQINVEQSIGLLLNFLLAAYDPEGHGKITVFAVKMALATLCGGKIMDKLRYIFSLISDSSGVMVYQKYDQFLKEVLKLPTAVFEGPSFGYTEQSARSCFSQQKKVILNSFLDTLMSDPPPQCLVWLPLLHRLANVENVFHPVECSYCHSESMMGFRYRCQQCHNYQLCQDCFWRGHASGSHSNQHQMKEYTSWKSPAKKLTNALSKSLSCASSREPLHPMFPDQPEKPLNLAHIV
ncbi:unnamed protein product [Ranitomeya imitator]|uniref:ZZ-type domain-containing protein n=1 Tax=Ranitomeya imitator TaxID=111125 RepID=A0ABN9KR90_9NEOB|nr:unnamed protein product [Ranitomeya imitator]